MSREGSPEPSPVFWNGRFVGREETSLSAFDRGFLYADALFDTMRTYRGVPFLLREHLGRLQRGARTLGIRASLSPRRWRSIIRELLERSNLDNEDAVVRITLSRGLDDGGLLPTGRETTTELAFARPLPSNLDRWAKRGVAAVCLPEELQPARVWGVKTTGYTGAVAGKRWARAQRAFEGLYTTSSGEVLEGTTSNFFAVFDGPTIVTPPLSSGVLPGITRKHVLGLAKSAGFRVAERSIRARDLPHASEAFLTASTIEVLPIRRLDRLVLSACPGLVVRELRQRYAASR